MFIRYGRFCYFWVCWFKFVCCFSFRRWDGGVGGNMISGRVNCDF